MSEVPYQIPYWYEAVYQHITPIPLQTDFPSSISPHSWNSDGARNVDVGNISPKAFRRRISFGTGALLGVEQSSFDYRPRDA